ncbi:unnamed protein product [Ambrosiozyma monospora]|uniref:Unnamed protein product n=1 Tax=Ambrosiozyma monospora TaxID=43982 RepID=A0ACB5SRU8_AMBMO|nr:unnamed protein product [Ambrosiozyma monospora]
MVPRRIDSDEDLSYYNEKAVADNYIGGGPIRLIDSPEKSISCFHSIKSFFQFRLQDTKDRKYEKLVDIFDTPDVSDSEANDTDFIEEKRSICSTFSADHVLSSTPTTKLNVTTDSFDSSSRLTQLRKLMKYYKIGVYIIPSEDEHQSEYTSPKDQRREFISGFTGSAGIAVVSLDEAALSTDGRYFLQAARQLDDNWDLLKQGVKGEPTWQEWAINRASCIKDSSFRSVAIDSRLISHGEGLNLKEKCFALNVEFTPLMNNLVDKVMKHESFVPKKPDDDHVFIHELRYSGEHALSKIKRVRDFMREHESFALVVSQLEEVAWLLNLRGNDISFNPVFFAYCIVQLDRIDLYFDKSKVRSFEVSNYLLSIPGLHTHSYNTFWNDLPSLQPATFFKEYTNVYVSNNASYALFTEIPSTYTIQSRSIITEFKGIKNTTEIRGNKLAQLKDSIALIRFFAWLEEKLIVKGHKVDELQAASKAEYFRSLFPNYKGLSFATIAATGPNASVVHYEPTAEEFSVIDPNAVFLLDSGAQFLEGTTDITRTVHFSQPTADEIRAYSLVLKGHLNVAMLIFQRGTSSYYIDSLARKPLAEHGLSYSHGTGHGIDTFICVHSGPCGLSPSKASYNYKPLEPGNFISDEPGYYQDNEFGIRIESDIMVVSKDKPSEGETDAESRNGSGSKAGLMEEEEWLGFEYFTLVPFCLNLIDKSILDDDQVEWVNSFHARVRHTVLPYLQQIKDDRAIAWLIKETQAL